MSKKYENLTITEAAQKQNVTRQAIYAAIKHGRLNANKQTHKWFITEDDLRKYNDTKYSREFSSCDGELIFNKDKGLYSVSQIAEKFNVPIQRVYYTCRQGDLKTYRKGAAWVISGNDPFIKEALFKSFNTKPVNRKISKQVA